MFQVSAPAFFYSYYVYDEQKSFTMSKVPFTAWILYTAQVLMIGVYLFSSGISLI